MRRLQPLIALTLALSLVAGAGTSAGTSAAQAARDNGSQANTPPTRSGERKMTRSDPEWQDIQDALDILDKEGKGWVRKCVEEMMDDENISLDTDLGSIAKYSGGLGPEEMYLDPSELPSGQSRKDASDLTPGGLLAQQAEYYKRLVSLAGTLLHECTHRQTGILGRAANYYGSKIVELSLSADGEEALTHHSEFLFYYGLFGSAQFSSTECVFLRQILDLMAGAIQIIEQEYSPYSLLDGMKEMLKEREEEYEKLCGGSSGATIVDGFWDEETDSLVGTVTKYHDVYISAYVYCEGKEREPVGGRVHGWDIPDRPVKEGETLTLTPPPVHQDAVLESLLVNGRPVPITDGKVTVTITGKTRIEFRYRCKKDLAAAAAAGQAALAEQARAAATTVAVLEGQEQALQALDLACEQECDKIRQKIADLQDEIAQANAELAALNGQLGTAQADKATTEQEIQDLDDALDKWNDQTPEERDTARREAAQGYEQATKDAAAARTEAAQDLQSERQDIDADRRAAANQGSGPYFAQLPGFRQRSRDAWDDYKEKTDGAAAEVADAWDEYRDADIERRHDQEMPGLQARLAVEQAAVQALEAQVAAKEAEIADLEAEMARLEERLRLCMERWQRVSDQLGLVRDALGAAQAHRDEVRDALGATGTGQPTPDEVRAAEERRQQLEAERQRLQTLLEENEAQRQELEDEARHLGESLRRHRAQAAEAGEAAGAAAGAAKERRDEADRQGAALEEDPGDADEDGAQALERLAHLYRFWQKALLASCGIKTPEFGDEEGWRAWEFAQTWQDFGMEAWNDFRLEAEALAEDAALRATVRDNPRAVQNRRASLLREADALDREAGSLRADQDRADTGAEEARIRQEQVEHEAMVAASFAFEAMLALAMVTPQLQALGAPDGALQVDIQATGEETGHVLDAVVTNLGTEVLVFVLERGLTFLSGSPDHTDMAVTEEARVEVPPGETVTVPVQGCSLEPDKAPPDQTGRGPDAGQGYRRGSVSATVLGILDATDDVLEDEGLEASRDNRTAVAQWALWRQSGMPRSRMTVAAFMNTVEFLGLLETGDLGDLGGLLGGLLGGNRRQQEAKGLMAVVDEVVARTDED
ncbi:hypothetical protein IIA16_02055 [bacterium]|nr:hypothetical protein [bacterium]